MTCFLPKELAEECGIAAVTHAKRDFLGIGGVEFFAKCQLVVVESLVNTLVWDLSK